MPSARSFTFPSPQILQTELISEAMYSFNGFESYAEPVMGSSISFVFFLVFFPDICSGRSTDILDSGQCYMLSIALEVCPPHSFLTLLSWSSFAPLLTFFLVHRRLERGAAPPNEGAQQHLVLCFQRLPFLPKALPSSFAQSLTLCRQAPPPPPTLHICEDGVSITTTADLLTRGRRSSFPIKQTEYLEALVPTFMALPRKRKNTMRQTFLATTMTQFVVQFADELGPQYNIRELTAVSLTSLLFDSSN